MIILFLSAPLAAKTKIDLTNREQFYKVEDLLQLIQKAKEAGFSKADIMNLTIQDGSEEINVMEYIAAVRNRDAARTRRMKEFLSKQFITPQDVFNELVTMEPDELGKLREELTRE